LGESEPETRKEALVARYRHLTGTVLPAQARDRARGWPVVNDHCFQRIVLDAVCGGVWYDHVSRPAYRNLTAEQAAVAVALCEAILDGSENVSALNRQSLRWRGKLRDRG
jgi:hypothetical protein